ncbi:Oidioi.mRNA.OKI2018_I69.chr2.g5234.t1.cds [Oikopleura dioica]|uniref:Oidioi.mRNA.OKI2018_I69.chr2.g5234.t1.cds n=1 Tax=Oikopleura dioica TaxID=34765 RepID=A0ABN7T334_OIKDI|nr:Oidioi.mRNA.OKI2018_I69.chr2.g5234.t1.cds [Oikopleura dioica]
MVIETLYDLIDQEEEEHEEIVKELYQKYMEQDVLSVAVGTLKRMDETKNEELEAAFKCIGLVESIIDGSDDQDIISKVANSGSFLLWLLERVRRRTINMVKVYAAEMLSILLQNEENQKIVGEKKGVDILLKQLAYFKKRNPKGQEEIELMENLFNSLCLVVQYVPNRKKFLEDEGLHLMNLMIREKKMSRNSALKVINHVVSGYEGRDNSIKYIEILGLKTLFPLFMKTPKRNKKTGHTENDHEEAIISIIGNLMRNLSGSLKRRLVDKFVELDHAKSERLLELHFKYAEKMEDAEEEVEQQAAMLAQEGVEMDEDMAYALRLEKGLFTLQQIDYIIVELYGSGIESLRERIISHLSMRKSSLKQIREVVKDYADNLGDGENEEAIEQERNRLLELAMGLM